MKPCSRCGQLFRAISNQRYCGSCRSKRSPTWNHRYAPTASFGRRVCACCGRPYEARAENQRFCSQRCKDRAKPAAVKAKYARPSHRLGRRAWAHPVASGLVRCRRGAACRFAELVDGELVGGLSSPVALAPGAPGRRGCAVASPEHRICMSPLRRGWRRGEEGVVTHAKAVAVVWGETPPAFSIGFEKPM